MLGVALDGEGVFVGELDRHVLLVDAGEFTFEGVFVLGLLDVELGREGALGRVRHLLEFRECVVEELEKGAHLLTVGAQCRSEAGEESHVSCLEESGWVGVSRCSNQSLW